MPSADVHIFSAASATERGLPPIELRFRPGPALVVIELAAGEGSGAVLAAEERGTNDRLIGRIELGLFSASLIIDRAGVVEEVARAAAEATLAGPGRGRLLGQGEIELAGGASGYRIDALLQLDEEGRFRPGCPYASWLALTGGDAVARGGVFAVVRCAGPSWAAAAELLDSLEIGGAAARQGGGGTGLPGLDMPLVHRR
ncbi:MAG TPA: hypothetical protein VK698_21410 [Kofleriaceae bacterium]|nr:hypothetical protein [Kofleriaceae bacterium]